MNTLAWNVGAVGPEQCIGAKIAFNESDGIVEIGELPKGCLVTKVVAAVNTAFNAATTNALTVGANDAVNDFVSEGITAGTAASYFPNVGKITAADSVVKAKYAGTGAAATAGEAEIFVFFARVHAE